MATAYGVCCFLLFKGVSNSVQVLFNCIEAVMELTLIILKEGALAYAAMDPRWFPAEVLHQRQGVHRTLNRCRAMQQERPIYQPHAQHRGLWSPTDAHAV